MDIYAVKIKGEWNVANLVDATAYGERGAEMADGRKVWSRTEDTAWLGVEGQEEAWALLETEEEIKARVGPRRA